MSKPCCLALQQIALLSVQCRRVSSRPVRCVSFSLWRIKLASRHESQTVGLDWYTTNLSGVCDRQTAWLILQRAGEVSVRNRFLFSDYISKRGSRSDGIYSACAAGVSPSVSQYQQLCRTGVGLLSLTCFYSKTAPVSVSPSVCPRVMVVRAPVNGLLWNFDPEVLV